MSIPFQTTVKAAGNILEAERIARLCWEKLQRDSKAPLMRERNKIRDESYISYRFYI